MLTGADDLYLPDVLAGPLVRRDNARNFPLLPDEGELVVPGYVDAGFFRVFVADGQAGRVIVRYRKPGIGLKLAEVEVVENPRGLPVKIDVASTAR
jgi:hypothetical protein